VTSRTVLGIGLAQLVNWGVLYYAFGVLLIPVERGLSQPRWIVAGAFSLALLISAAMAPAVGRWIDCGHGPRLMTIGGWTAAALLLVWAAVPHVTTLYIAWAGLGVCMAATLYEPAFAIVGRGFDTVAERLRALAAVTIFGGLAGTVFLPTTAVVVARVGWRWTAVLLAVAMAAAALIARWAVPAAIHGSRAVDPPAAPAVAPPTRERGFGMVLTAFGSASLAHAALTTTLIPALSERRISPTTAALLGGTMGLMQLPGRALMLHGRLSASPSALLITSLGLQGAGLAVYTVAGTPAPVGLGVALFAAGSGLATLVRPYLVLTLYDVSRTGHLNGLLARAQQLARAGAPIAAVAVGSAFGYRWIFAVLAVHFVGLALFWWWTREIR
jgi:MFS family permease